MQFLDFVRVNYLMKLSRSLPTTLVDYDKKWSGTRSHALQEADQGLKEMYRQHKIRQFMKPLSQEDIAQVRI